MSLGGGVVIWGSGADDGDAAADRRRSTRCRGRRLRATRDPPAPALHRLAPELRGDRRGRRADASTAIASAPRCWRSSSRVGFAAHALDELRGRPLRTGSPTARSWTLAGRRAGRSGRASGSPAVVGLRWLLAVRPGRAPSWSLAYNLELAGGRFHSDAWFALAWGGFPALTSATWANALTLRAPGVLVVAGCIGMSVAQRRLSTPRANCAAAPCRWSASSASPTVAWSSSPPRAWPRRWTARSLRLCRPPSCCSPPRAYRAPLKQLLRVFPWSPHEYRGGCAAT